MTTDYTKCIHCHKCRDSCDFLNKYGIDIGDSERLRELAFHCFLIGTCTRVCPVQIDGRQVILNMRREQAAGDGEREIRQTYRGLVREKRDYIYRNWRHASSGTVYFPGCNFPSMYPKTNALIARQLAAYGIGTAYECCGKPIAELGMQADEERILADIRRRLQERGIGEIVTACPNCRHFFGDRLGVKVTGIFAKLKELGLGQPVEGNVHLYVPCPDRGEQIWIREMRPFIRGEISLVEGVQCCGLGGSAMVKEPEVADGFVKALKADLAGREEADRAGAGESVVTYCASCIGRFRRSGIQKVDHLLAKVMGTDEQADTRKSYINRVLTRFK